MVELGSSRWDEEGGWIRKICLRQRLRGFETDWKWAEWGEGAEADLEVPALGLQRRAGSDLRSLSCLLVAGAGCVNDSEASTPSRGNMIL